MCGPTGTMFCFGMSVFGCLFMGTMALLLKNNYEYLGEWYETAEPDHPGFAEQQAKAMHNCWTVSGIYGGIAAACLVGIVVHSIRGK